MNSPFLVDSPLVCLLFRLRPLLLAWFCVSLFAGASFGAGPYVQRGAEPLYKDFLDTNFPFFEATLDLRGVAPAGNEDNLIPRGVILPLEDDVFVCFDTELLRVAGVWQGGSVTPRGLALLSYEVPLRKMGGGQKDLPKPIGEVKYATGLYPGWQRPQDLAFVDPRSRWVDENELGRGPLKPTHGEWMGMEDAGGEAILHYRLFGGVVKEAFRVEREEGRSVLSRTIAFEGVKGPISLVVTDLGSGSAATAPTFSPKQGVSLREGRYLVYEPKGRKVPDAITLRFDLGEGRVSVDKGMKSSVDALEKSAPRWSEPAVSRIELGEPQGSYAVDDAEIPYPNPWKRRIRPVGIDFFPNGDALIVTFDGDVYRVSGLGVRDESVSWRRIAAGFNEPHSVRIRGDEIFVLSRLGLTRLVDRDADGETDFYEMFCNRFTQSADTRDYPLSLSVRQDGSFVFAKGGQQQTAESPHSGRVMSISRDGKKVEYVAFGLRNGYVSNHPSKDLLTASDQQGNWVPSTPFHIVRKGSFLGYAPGYPFKETPIQPAALWLPHRVAQSGTVQLWPTGPRAGALADSILYLEYKKPAIIKIYIPEDEEIVQTAGTPLPLEFPIPLLKGAINPKDGQVYLVGFQIWDSMSERLEGLCRLRVVEETDRLPTGAEVSGNGVRLSFAQELDPEVALNPANYQASSWEYVRTKSYGSAQYRGDGNPGADEWMVHSVMLSEDRKSVFLAIDGVKKTMQLEVQYNLFDEWTPVYFTVNQVESAELTKHGFADTDFSKLFASEPAPRKLETSKPIVSVARGQQLYIQMGCVGCHSIDGTTEGRSGPTWLGAYRAKRTLQDGTSVRVDEEYLRVSILDPNAVVTKDYDDADAGMPSYQGILSDEDVESLIIFIRSLDKR